MVSASGDVFLGRAGAEYLKAIIGLPLVSRSAGERFLMDPVVQVQALQDEFSGGGKHGGTALGEVGFHGGGQRLDLGGRAHAFLRAERIGYGRCRSIVKRLDDARQRLKVEVPVEGLLDGLAYEMAYQFFLMAVAGKGFELELAGGKRGD